MSYTSNPEDVLPPRPVVSIGRERAAELLARNQAKIRVDGYTALMLGALDDGLIEAGEDPMGGLHWRVTSKGLAMKAELERHFSE